MRPVHRVFVTGATGFVGRAVIQALRGEGYVVRCLVRRGSEPSLRGVGAIERVEGDVLAPQLLDEGMAGCGAVVHLVGIIREHIATNTTFYRVHVQGTVNVVAAAAAAGVRRYVHMSALGAREGAPSRYHRTKWAAEEVVRACGLPWTIFRPSVIYGRGDGFVSPLARLVRRLPVVPLVGGGRLQPVAVEQVAQAVTRALALPAAVKQTYEVGGPDVVTLGELVDLIGRALGRRRVLKLYVPAAVARVATRVLQAVPYFPLTPDHLRMLEEDNVVCDPAPFPGAFGLAPLPLATGLRRLLG
ncbi:MAG: hypothetical protein DME12_08480 [Candidatus Rokuibacteriota bacterium]|nr:MAG: hypothetical protein DME12_08480 [Candidatus Rokubacteria bacterium]PYM67253.1 MAG: hypothetical protein DME11_04300 [Candidatus Rokubacteria bacterium]PYN65304.1 MAG: hypothetical protein DMD93_21175 [Candidatus Rokubacteria bacterium]